MFKAAVVALALCFACGLSTAGEVASLAAEVGLSAETMAASGLSATDAQAVLTRLAGETTARQAIADAADHLVSLSFEESLLLTAYRANPGDEAARTAWRNKRQEVVSARAELAQARTNLFQQIISEQTANRIASLTACRSAQGVRAPFEFRVVARSAEDWQVIESAIVAEARAQAEAEPVPDEASSVLNPIRASSSVANAASSLGANLISIRQVLTGF